MLVQFQDFMTKAMCIEILFHCILVAVPPLLHLLSHRGDHLSLVTLPRPRLHGLEEAGQRLVDFIPLII